ncbi:HVO_2922 family protein [Halosimplex aquaticum]|uniref:HVO_2922 family protein n=1 Tax=Halosimplex aquaticum TaxID=3026162 RepID=A0ABD5Y2Z3_9EURY|nr:HVO_2922 family protein [Halosimplex aquaticum]
MSDNGDETRDTDEASVDDSIESESTTAGSAGDAFESERTATRAEAAAVLRGLADGVDAGAVSIGAGEDAVTAAIPDEFDFEVEYERGDDEVEIEVELEWATDDEPPTSDAVPADGSEDAAESADDEPTTEADQPAVETATVKAAGEAADVDGSEGGEDAGGPEDETTAEASASAPDAAAEPPVEAVAPLVSQARFELFRDRANEWRWRLVHRNGNVIASSGEGYTRKHNAEKGLRSVMRNAPDATLVEDE